MLSPNAAQTSSISGDNDIHRKHHSTLAPPVNAAVTQTSRRGSTAGGGGGGGTLVQQQQAAAAAVICNVGSRRKSSLSYQQQLQLLNTAAAGGAGGGGGDDGINCNSIGNCSDVSPGRYSAHSNELFVQQQHHHHHHHSQHHVHLHGKLSLQPIDRYEDALTCCLPPPSPAPNSDRYIMGGSATTNTNCDADIVSANNVNGQHTLHLPAHYNNYECNTPTQQQQQIHQQHQQQHLHSSTSTSSLSTNSGSLSSSGSIGSCTVSPIATSLAASNIQIPAHKYVSNAAASTIQRAISPSSFASTSSSSRFRINERFRDLPSKSGGSAANDVAKTVTAAVAGGTGASNATSSSAVSSRFAVSSTHFLTQSTPLVSNDTYTSYLSSTVHTPVKRYVPTPPPSNELYADISISPLPPAGLLPASGNNATNAINNKCFANSTTTPQNVNTLPYRFRVKCCANDQQQQQPPPSTNSLHHHYEHRGGLSVTDYYATSPRTRATTAATAYTSYNKCNLPCNGAVVNAGTTVGSGKDSPLVLLHEQQLQLQANNSSGASSTSSSCLSSSGASSASPSASATGSPITVGGGVSTRSGASAAAPSSRSVTAACHMSDFAAHTPSIEYMSASLANSSSISSTIDGGGSCIITPASLEPTTAATVSAATAAAATSSISAASATCLHCNTARRTAGVHQTTQTTGPISPIPLTTQLPSQVNYCGTSGGSGSTQGGHEQTTLSSTLTPSTSESQISNTLMSSSNFQQQQQQQQLQRMQQTQLDLNEQSDDISAAYNQQQQQQIYAQPKSQFQSMLPPQQQQQQQHQKQQQHQQLLAQQQHHIQQQQQSTLSNRTISLQSQQQQQQRYSSKKRQINQYLRKEIARFFGVEASSEAEECLLWHSRQRRLALRRFGTLRNSAEMHHTTTQLNDGGSAYADDAGTNNGVRISRASAGGGNNSNQPHYHHNRNQHNHQQQHHNHHHASERPDILPAQDADANIADIEDDELPGEQGHINRSGGSSGGCRHFLNADFQLGDHVERKASVATMIMSSLTYIVHTLNKRQPRQHRQWSRSFAPLHVNHAINEEAVPASDICDGLNTLQDEEVFFDTPGAVEHPNGGGGGSGGVGTVTANANAANAASISPASGISSLRSAAGVVGGGQSAKIMEHQRQIYMGERVHGWRTTAIIGGTQTLHNSIEPTSQQSAGAAGDGALQQQHFLQGLVTSSGNTKQNAANHNQQQQTHAATQQPQQQPQHNNTTQGNGGSRISAQLLDGVLENSRRPLARRVKLFSVNDLDDRTDHRPFFTYWINTVQILVLFLSLICYGIGPIGIGVEQKTGQVLVTSLSLQTVQHTEQRNVWIGPRNNDLVHMGAKFATCMRRDAKIMDVMVKTRRQERETACCIRNDDSGCVQSSQADCSVRGLFPTKSISTWKKWSPGESGPGGRISGSVCGLDPKYCDAPASVAPYEWPDDITKWPICRKTNAFSQRFRYKDHTAEHMVCEVIGHPCCTGAYGECRITTREYCDFVNGYFHEEASLCSQISCLNNVCGMFPFFSIEVPDQFYRLFTSLCLHAGILHLAITVAFQHVFLADLERLIGPIRTAIVYIGSGLAGNITSAVLVPYKPEVGPLASLSGVVASLVVLLILMHWKQLRKPHVALFKLIVMGALFFGIGTLPWQLNFAGLLAGIFCGIFLTVALVPFVSISKYGRKSKINLIWSCVIFHVLIYSIMLAIFYIFPTELTNLNFGEVLSNSFNPNVGNPSNGVNVAGGSDVLSSSSGSGNRLPLMQQQKQQHQQQQQQFHYHHRSDDIVTHSGSGSQIAQHFLQAPLTQEQEQQQLVQQKATTTTFYHRMYYASNSNSNANTININNNNMNNNFRYDYSDFNSKSLNLNNISNYYLYAAQNHFTTTQIVNKNNLMYNNKNINNNNNNNNNNIQNNNKNNNNENNNNNNKDTYNNSNKNYFNNTNHNINLNDISNTNKSLSTTNKEYSTGNKNIDYNNITNYIKNSQKHNSTYDGSRNNYNNYNINHKNLTRNYYHLNSNNNNSNNCSVKAAFRHLNNFKSNNISTSNNRNFNNNSNSLQQLLQPENSNNKNNKNNKK